ncbi:copper chaperone PCu(A)C [Snodgrassella sp. CFCC 13594]|uniref:copper chaperone PCu(A)C n=1 Tax=Snodgrassella sp. CFCC 13594 TaxID=1775559 RepID=UPI00082BEC7B|nr:copper chaperone PCu(A)C [Snodgrassella sp. CFCC 13594]
MKIKSLFFAASLLSSTGLTLAHGMTAEQAWARFTVPGVTMGGVFMNLNNHTGKDDALVSVSTPIATQTEIHETINIDGMMKMRPVPQGVALPNAKITALQPGGHHIMLMGLKQPLKVGTQIPLTLTFKHTHPITIQVPVRKEGLGATSTAPMMH